MKHKEKRGQIVDSVLSFLHTNNIEYRTGWLLIYEEYEKKTKIPVLTWYKFNHKSKLDFLADYEDLYGTLTKLHELIKELK